jgi:hypothetical protein
MERRHGLVFRRHTNIESIDFTPHGAGLSGQPAYFELHNLDEPLEPDELLVLKADDGGPAFTCQALDRTNVCAVVASFR